MARGDFPSSKQDQFVLRFPEGMRDQIRQAAEANNRSMNAEIVARLEDFSRIKQLGQALGKAMIENARLQDEKEKLEGELEAAREVRERFFTEDGSLKPILTIPQPLLDRIGLAAEQNHRSIDAEALNALEALFPPQSIDVDLLSGFLDSLIGVSAPDGDQDYLAIVNDALARAKKPWTVKAGWDGEVRFFPYASANRELDKETEDEQ